MAKKNRETIIIISGELTDLNTYVDAERTNKYRASAIKKEETERVYWQCKIQRIKPIGKKEAVIFHWYNKNSRKDFDNIEFAQKFIWDGLVLAKVLPDDSQKYVPAIRIHKHDVDPKRPRVEITFNPDSPF